MADLEGRYYQVPAESAEARQVNRGLRFGILVVVASGSCIAFLSEVAPSFSTKAPHSTDRAKSIILLNVAGIQNRFAALQFPRIQHFEDKHINHRAFNRDLPSHTHESQYYSHVVVKAQADGIESNSWEPHRLEAIKAKALETITDDSAKAWVQAEDVQRMLIASDGDIALAEKKLKNAVTWRMKNLDLVQAVRNRLVNVVAIGQENRPLIFTSAAMQRAGDVVAAQWASGWEEAIQTSSDPFVKLDFVVDNTGFQPFLNFDVRPFLRLAPAPDTYFANRINRIIIIDMPSAALFIWKALRPVLAPDVVEKIKFVSRQKPEEMELLYELASTASMRQMLEELVEKAGQLTPKTSATPLLKYVDDYVAQQSLQSEGLLDSSTRVAQGPSSGIDASAEAPPSSGGNAEVGPASIDGAAVVAKDSKPNGSHAELTKATVAEDDVPSTPRVNVTLRGLDLRQVMKVLLSSRSSTEEKSNIFQPFRELRQSNTIEYERALDEMLSLMDSVEGNLLCQARLPFPFPSLRTKLGSLRRLLSFVASNSSDPMQRKRGLLIILAECSRTKGGIRELEKKALCTTDKAVDMAEMLRRTPEGLETPSYTVVAEKSEQITRTLWEVRKYSTFTVCSVPVNVNIASEQSSVNRSQEGKTKGVQGFRALARYIFGGNQQQTKMAMTTPVIMSAQNDKMSFVMPSRFWKEEALAGAPVPLEGTGVVLEKAPAMVKAGGDIFAVLWFDGYAVGNYVLEQKAKLLALVESDESLDLASGPASEPFLMQYNDPFVVPWKRRNEVAVAVTLKHGIRGHD